MIIVRINYAVMFFSLFMDMTEVDTIENFNYGEVLLQLYSNRVPDPGSWSLINSNTANNSSFSLKLFGNNWKFEPIAVRHYAIDEEVVAVICYHNHVLQGFEVYKGKLIAHSPGNYIFGMNYPETFPSVVPNSEINETGFYNYSITTVYLDDYVPLRASGEPGLHILDNLAKRSKDLNTYPDIDKKELTAEIVIGTTKLLKNSVLSVTDVQLLHKGSSGIYFYRFKANEFSKTKNLFC
jgi:hypothetical protein